MPEEFTLSIETAIRDGSIALFRRDAKLDEWVGKSDITKSDDILAEVKNLFSRNNLDKKQIKKIVVSRGPGSYTGVRLGVAIGKGLSKSLQCNLIGVSALEALFWAFKSPIEISDRKIITAVPAGRDQICWQQFDLQDSQYCSIDNHHISTILDFFNTKFIEGSEQFSKLIAHRTLFSAFQDLRAKFPGVDKTIRNSKMIDAGENIALLNGLLGIEKGGEVSASKLIYSQEKVFSKLLANESK